LSKTAAKSLWSFVKSFNDLCKQTQGLLLFPVFFVSGLQWVVPWVAEPFSKWGAQV